MDGKGDESWSPLSFHKSRSEVVVAFYLPLSGKEECGHDHAFLWPGMDGDKVMVTSIFFCLESEG